MLIALRCICTVLRTAKGKDKGKGKNGGSGKDKGFGKDKGQGQIRKGQGQRQNSSKNVRKMYQCRDKYIRIYIIYVLKIY